MATTIETTSFAAHARRWRTGLMATALITAAGTFAASPAAARSPGPPPSGSSVTCDYDCLTGMMDSYLAAVVKHDPDAAPMAREVKFTENAVRIPLGEGLWLSTTQGPTSFKVVAADPVSGQVGLLAMIKRWGQPALLAVRLRVKDRKIVEAENELATDLSAADMANLKTPRPALLADVPPGEQTSRAAMLAAGNGYFDAIEHSDGSLAPFADDCVRHENGIQTTTNTGPRKADAPVASLGASAEAMAKIGALGCAAQIDAGMLSYITRIQPRHLLIIDQRKGLVYGFPRFVHRGVVRKITIKGVPGVDVVPMNFGPIDLQAAEMFKVRSGKIHEIEAMGFLNAYLTPTGWDKEYGSDE